MKFAKIFLPCLLLALVAIVSLVSVDKRPVKEYQIEGMHVYEMAAADETKPVILYLHGGAYRQGITPSHWKILSEISKATGCGFVMPDYPLLPEHTALEAHTLVLKLYSELLKRFPASKIIIPGSTSLAVMNPLQNTTTGFISTNYINLVYLGQTAWMHTIQWYRHSTATCRGSRPPTFSLALGKYSTPTSSIAVKK